MMQRKPNEDDTRLPIDRAPEQALTSHSSCLNKMKINTTSTTTKKTRQISGPRLMNYSPMALCVYLTVILSTQVLTNQIQSVLAQQQDLGGAGNQLMPHHSSAHSQSALFKDLSGPTSGKIQTLDVICGKNFMTVRAEFSGPFYGIVFSKGTYGHENCIYVKPNSGLTHAAFNVYYDQCGTKPDLQGKFYENTIVIQYGSDIIEAYDEAKRLRCEWFEAYEKPATFKPAIPVADLEVVEMNFQGDDIDCWMEIQEGSGPGSREVSKIVPVGQPMTIVVAINDYSGVFDMRVKSCVAHDGVQQPISLTDEFGCVLRPKMLTPFQKVRNPVGNKKATILSYSRFLAFKFPDSMTVQIQCTVEVCRHGCADTCQRIPSIAATTIQPELSLTARWPAASNNQPAIASPDAPPRVLPQAAPSAGRRYESTPPTVVAVEDSSPYKPPARVQFNQQPQPRQPDQRQAYGGYTGQRVPPREALQPEDTMSGSDSNQQPAVQAAQPGQRFQYLVPNSGNRRSASPPPSFNNRPSVTQMQQSITSTTSTPSTSSTQASEEAADQTASSEEPTIDRLNSPGDQTPQAIGNENSKVQVEGVDSEQVDNKSEASQVKPTVVSSQQEQPETVASSKSEGERPVAAGNEAASDATQESGNKSLDSNGSNGDELAAADSSPTSTQQQQQQQSSSSLKTVEVEIPANEDPVRALIASSSAHNHNQFNSVRLSNVDNFNAGYKSNSYSSPDQVIQPREQMSVNSEKRSDKLDNENSNIEAMMANGKSRFGTRSQHPQSSIQTQASSADQQPSSYTNHQMASAAAAADQGSDVTGNNKDQESAVHSDKVLIDRSDDSSSLTEVASSSLADPIAQSASSESVVKTEIAADDESVPADDSSSAAATGSASVDSAGSASKVKPVVGTEELASGPLQLEDRMGSPAQQDSLEEALTRLQQQVPQSAALINSQEQAAASSNQESERRSDNADSLKPVDQSQQQSSENKPLDRSDISRAQKSPDNQHKQAQPEVSQPFPNVAGQAKVMPDPSSSLNARGSLLAQASNVDGATNSVLPAPVSSNQQPAAPGVSNVTPEAKPVAQVTNVPITIGIPQSQIPAIQQLSQQLAYFQQQAQIQQQQLPKSTTTKPARGRFGLLSPQAAIQAVASRFLPKSSAQATVQQQQQQQHLGMSPQLLGSINKLTPEQQQKLFASAPALQTQQQKYQTNQISQQVAQQQPQPIYQQQSRFIPPQVQMQQQQTQQQPTKASLGAGLFRRFTHQHQPQQAQQAQHPLVRSRRSAIMPNGKQGNGEVGMTKTFMVVTGLDLAFMPNTTDTDLPPILEGRRLVEDDVIYGVCMPVVSLTFILTCAFWLIVFIVCFCIYMLMKARKLQRQTAIGEKR